MATTNNSNRIWIWMLLLLLAIFIGVAIFFYVKAMKATEQYETELTNRYRLNATDSIIRYQYKLSQNKVDSYKVVIGRLTTSLDSINKADNDIRSKYDDIYKDINTTHSVDSQVRLAYRLLAINRKLSLAGK